MLERSISSYHVWWCIGRLVSDNVTTTLINPITRWISVALWHFLRGAFIQEDSSLGHNSLLLHLLLLALVFLQ